MSTPIGDAAAAAAIPPPGPSRQSRSPTLMGHIHRDLHQVGHVVARMVPVLEAITANKGIDDAVQLLVQLAGLGPEEHELAPVLAVLRDLIQRKAAQQQPAPQAHPTGGQVTAPDGTAWGALEQPPRPDDAEAM